MMGSAGDIPFSSALVIYNEGSHLVHNSSEWRTSRSWLETCYVEVLSVLGAVVTAEP